MARRLKVPALPARLPSRLPAISRPRLPKLPDADAPDVFEEMTLLEHMEELRDRIVKSVLAVGVAFIAGVFLAGPLLKRLQVEANAVGGFDVVSPTDPITLYFKVALYVAIGFALPVIMWQLVGFLLPGLTGKEKRFLILSMPFVIVLFLLGVAYGFFFAAPRALTFLSSFMSDIYEWSPEGG
ncbi:MAG: twin-arginine translocase subunit TatC, partial [Thermomicrobiales bacterium]|nr:twin-arginine translocase subunit TatC [Thermomicrobiales bacterium]